MLMSEPKSIVAALLIALVLPAAPARTSPLESGPGHAPGILRNETSSGPRGAKPAELLKVGGDLRLRHESEVRLPDRPDRHRERVRLRVDARYPVTTEVSVEGRVTTGSRSDPNSPHQTLGEAFHRFELNLDRALVRYKPHWAKRVTAVAGKLEHPFWRNPVYGDLVWDADVSPEGATQTYSYEGSGRVRTARIAMGEYILLEQGRGGEAGVFAAQGRVVLSPAEQVSFDGALAYYRYGNLTPGDALLILSESGDNARAAGDSAFASGFHIVHPILAWSYASRALVLTAAGEYIRNTEAHTSRNEGYALGTFITTRGTRVYYQWQRVEQDATLAAVAQDDFLYTTNHISHVVGVKRSLAAGLALHGWGLASRRVRGTPEETSRYAWRLRMDLDITF